MGLVATIEASRRCLVMPIGVYAGLALTGGNVRDAVSNAEAQAAAVLALRDRLGTPFLVSAMDLSAEAEAFGCEVRLTDGEVPAVLGRLVTDASGADRLAVPEVGAARTRVHLAAVAALARTSGAEPVLGCMIGPFSLAGRLFGMAEALEATVAEPEIVLTLLEKVTPFLCAYARAFREVGAAGVVMAEPAAGLLSPRGLGRFSTTFVRRIVDEVQNEGFALVLHNCGARSVHLPRVLEAGAAVYHFGAPMDMAAAATAAAEMSGRPVVSGNVDPTFIHDATAEAVETEGRRVLESVGSSARFVLASGCDLPPGTPLEHVAALFRAAEGATVQ